MELHPRINSLTPALKQSKIILGSFPTWSLSNSKIDEIKVDKRNARIENNDFPFFFGSSVNRFWNWYNKYVDCDIELKNVDSLKKSLKSNSIGITDLIISCKRKDKSSLDKHLTKRTYNHNFFKYPRKGVTLKILCTSKGVMNEMLLNQKFFSIHSELKINIKKSDRLQHRLIKKFNGNQLHIKKPFCTSIETGTGGIIECVSIPSPGSPFRRLIDFGFDTNDSNQFLDNYLNVVFDWFTE